MKGRAGDQECVIIQDKNDGKYSKKNVLKRLPQSINHRDWVGGCTEAIQFKPYLPLQRILLTFLI